MVARRGGWHRTCVIVALAAVMVVAAEGIASGDATRIRAGGGRAGAVLRDGRLRERGVLDLIVRREDELKALRGGGARAAGSKKQQGAKPEPYRKDLPEEMNKSRVGGTALPYSGMASPRTISPSNIGSANTPLKKPDLRTSSLLAEPRTQTPIKMQANLKTPSKAPSKTPLRRDTAIRVETPIKKAPVAETPMKSSQKVVPRTPMRSGTKAPPQGGVTKTLMSSNKTKTPLKRPGDINLVSPIKKAPPRMQTPLKRTNTQTPVKLTSPPQRESTPRRGTASASSSPMRSGRSPVSSPWRSSIASLLSSPIKSPNKMFNRSGSADAARRRSASQKAVTRGWKLPALQMPSLPAVNLQGFKQVSREAVAILTAILASVVAWRFRLDVARVAMLLASPLYPVLGQATKSVHVTLAKSVIIYHFARSAVRGIVRFTKAAVASLAALAKASVIAVMTPRGRLSFIALVASTITASWSAFLQTCRRISRGLDVLIKQVHQAIHAIVKKIQKPSLPTPLEFCSLLIQNLALVPQTVRQVPNAVQSMLLQLISGKRNPQEPIGNFAKGMLGAVSVISLYTAWTYYLVNSNG